MVGMPSMYVNTQEQPCRRLLSDPKISTSVIVDRFPLTFLISTTTLAGNAVLSQHFVMLRQAQQAFSEKQMGISPRIKASFI